MRAASLHERVLLVEAGPGWGKTTAVRAAFPGAQYIEVPSGARPSAFHLALLSALGVSPADAGSVVARLARNPDSVTRSIVDYVPPRTTLIVDDVQRLDAHGAQLVEALVEAQDVQLVIVGRSMAVLPVGSWMSRGLIGMPFGPDTLAFRAENVAELLNGLPYSKELMTAIVTTFAGWPIAASLAASMLRRGYPPAHVIAQLGDGIATIAGSTLKELPSEERRLLIEAALMSAYGIRPTAGHLAMVRRLGFPESASGLHEIVVSAVLKSVGAAEKSEVAEKTALDDADPSAVLALLAAEAPHTLRERSWHLLAPLHDHYDRASLERLASHHKAPPAAAAAARCFVLVFSSHYREAAAIAEQILSEVARRSHATAVRLARVFLFDGPSDVASSLLQNLESDEAVIRIHRDCILGNIHRDRNRLNSAMELANATGDLSLIAYSSIHASLIAARLGHLDDAEGYAARGEEAARAGGSVLLEARALKMRYGIAMLRANLDLAAVHVGRLIALQSLVGDPEERAGDLVAAFEIEVLAGRAARAAAYEDSIRKLGHGWLGMETYAVCRAIQESWDGLMLSAADRVASFAAAAPDDLRQFPLSLGAFLATAAGASDRAIELLSQIPAATPSVDAYILSHREIAAAFAAAAEVQLGRVTAASARLRPEPRTSLGAVFIEPARRYVVNRDIAAFADAMRSSGFAGVAMMFDACGLDSERSPLTRAERSVLSYLASGMDAPSIASLTGRSLHTIKNQRRSIISKLGASNTMEAVAVARRLGLL